MKGGEVSLFVQCEDQFQYPQTLNPIITMDIRPYTVLTPFNLQLRGIHQKSREPSARGP